MWKKDDRQDDVATPRPAPAFAPVQERELPSTPTPDSATAAAKTESATIGRSISVRGDVTGDEDLLIQGRVEGSVDLQQHSVTVGRDGKVVASIVGRVVTIEGRVEGNITGGEQVVLRSSAHVKGDIRAPRVVLENGARFRGLVDMGEGEEEDQGGGTDARRTTENAKAGTGTTGAPRPSGSGTTVASRAAASHQTEAGGATSEPVRSSSGSNSGKAKKQDDPEMPVPV